MNESRFKPGQSGNLKGRPKGAKNKVSLPLKQEIESFLSEQWPTVRRNFKKMDATQQIMTFERLLKFVLPQPRQTDLTVDFNQLSDSQMDEITNRLIASYES